MKSGIKNMFISFCLLLASGLASASDLQSGSTCSLSLSLNNQQCAGFSILDSKGQVLSQCLDLLAARDTFVSLMKSDTCQAFQCSLKTLSQCADHGGYAVTNENGESISACETARAAIDDLHFLTDSGICVFGGW